MHKKHGVFVRAVIALQEFQFWLAMLAIALMMMVTVVDVTMRYLFNQPLRGAYDFTETMLVILVFNGFALCFWSRSHIVIDLVDQFVSARFRRILIKAADVLSFGTLLLLATAMLKPALQAYAYSDRKLELNLPLYILWGVALAGMAGALLSALCVIFSAPAEARNPSVDGPQA